MPKVQALVQKVDIQGGQLLGTLQFNARIPKRGEWVTVKWGSTRTMAQNALYWKYLSWLIDHGGLKEHGHFDPQALHENLKAHFLAEKVMTKGEFVPVEEPSTTLLGKADFGEYFTKCDQFFRDFFEVNTQPFWDQYEENKI